MYQHMLAFLIRSFVRFWFILLVTIGTASTVGAAAYADEGPSTPEIVTPASPSGPLFVIRPADGVEGDYFTVEAEPGSVHELHVVLGNAGEESLQLRTFVADTVSSTNGGFAVAEADEEPSGTSTWIDYPDEVVEFEPGKGIERDFTVTVPSDATPGQYIAGLVLQTAEPSPIQGNTLFTQTIRKTVAVLIVVPGAQDPEFSLGSVEVNTTAGITSVVIPVQNSGNVLVKPEGNLTLKNQEGATVFEVPVDMDSVYAHMTDPLAISLWTGIPDGEYELTVDLFDQASGAAASIQNQPITITMKEPASEPFELAGDVTLKPDETDPVFADVSAEITNNGGSSNSSEVVLDVMKDGGLTESFTIASSLALPAGTTEVSQRYIPPAGFESGEWSFVLRLNVVDPFSGAATTVATVDDIPTITVP